MHPGQSLAIVGHRGEFLAERFIYLDGELSFPHRSVVPALLRIHQREISVGIRLHLAKSNGTAHLLGVAFQIGQELTNLLLGLRVATVDF
jgi:hypothetical protein